MVGSVLLAWVFGKRLEAKDLLQRLVIVLSLSGCNTKATGFLC